jgi:hypothetical protein
MKSNSFLKLNAFTTMFLDRTLNQSIDCLLKATEMSDAELIDKINEARELNDEHTILLLSSELARRAII